MGDMPVEATWLPPVHMQQWGAPEQGHRGEPDPTLPTHSMRAGLNSVVNFDGAFVETNLPQNEATPQGMRWNVPLLSRVNEAYTRIQVRPVHVLPAKPPPPRS